MSLFAVPLLAANLIHTNAVENGQATTNYILDSPFLRVMVSPQRGGGITKLFFKKAKLFLNDGLSFTEQVYHHFPVKDQIVEDFESLEQTGFTVEQAGNDTKSKVVSLTLSALSANITNLQLLKTYRLADKECALYIDYSLRNTGLSDINAGLWVHTHLRTVGANSAERNIFFTPTSTGITNITHLRAVPVSEYYWVLDPPLNWKAHIGLESGVGTALVTDYAPLSCFRDWYELNGNRSSTDLVFRQQKIHPQEAWTTKIALIPFRDMNRVDGVINDKIVYAVSYAAAGMDSNHQAKVSLSLAFPLPYPDNLGCKLWLQSTNNMPLTYPGPASFHDTNTQSLILQSTASVKAGTSVHFSNIFRKPVDGIYNYTLQLYDCNGLYGQATMPIAIGDVATNLVIQPMETMPTGEECIRPYKMLRRKIPDSLSESFKK